MENNGQESYKKVKGLTYISQFITKQQEQELIKNILTQQWNTKLKRRTQHYGYQYNYENKNQIKSTKPIPQWTLSVKNKLQSLLNQLSQQKNNKNKSKQCDEKQHKQLKQHKQQLVLETTENNNVIKFNQLIINQYIPGQGINPHIDNPKLFSSPIISLSLGSDCIMQFDNEDEEECVQIILRRRSIIILDQQARYKWKHSIPARKKDNGKLRSNRWSLTWRIMKDSIEQASKITEQDFINGGKKIKTDE